MPCAAKPVGFPAYKAQKTTHRKYATDVVKEARDVEEEKGTSSCMIFANKICKQVPNSMAQELLFVLSALSQKDF